MTDDPIGDPAGDPTPDLASDRGLTLGVGLFETILAREGHLVLWDPHLARLTRGCAALGLPAPDPALCRAAADRALAAAGLGIGRAAIRLTWTGGPGARGLDPPEHQRPRLLATASAPAPPVSALRLHVSGVRRNASSPTSRLKTLSSLDPVAARAEARRAGADEALMLNTAGDIACAAAGNIFWIAGGILHTPALDCGVLDGIVRAEIIAAARGRGLIVDETAAPLAALIASDGAFVSNSLIGTLPVSRIGERVWPAEEPRIAQLRRSLIPAEMAP
jgi:branched-chain amino acid aminotransferase/4-amino-4-deoxychorismate lyase